MGSNRLFGSSGIRGVVGEDLTIELCGDVGQALGSILPAHPRVCIATDARLSRDTIREAIVSGLLSAGTDIIDLGMLPTPALAFLTRECGFDAGIMITASHNPPEFNGIKLFNSDSSGYSRAQEEEIERVLQERRFRTAEKGKLSHDHEARERYFQSIISMFPDWKRKFRIVVDPGNGAASGFASELFSRIGLDVLSLNDEPDGSFPNRSPEPKEDTLAGTIEFLRSHNADLAVCFDGDADRVVFCDKEGFLGFTEMIGFMSRIMVKRTGKRRIATTVEAGQLLDLALNELGAEVVRGKVGDIYAAHLAREMNAALGVEAVGVYIFPELGYYPDSMFAALTLLSHLDHPRQIREFINSLPPTFPVKEKVPCPREAGDDVMSELERRIDSQETSLFEGREKATVNKMDGLRIEWDPPQAGWLLIRPSGTEPAIRVTVEFTLKEEARELAGKAAELVRDVVSNFATTGMRA